MNAFDYFFEHSAALQKDFVVGPAEKISYVNLHSNCQILSAEVARRFGQGRNILLISENSVFFITVYLSIIRSGNVCIPLSPTLEPAVFRDIKERTGSDILFVSDRLAGKHADADQTAITPGQVATWIATGRPERHEMPNGSFDGERLAEIIFTSGSTGEQKGVMITHHNLIANTASIVEYLNLKGSDTMEVVMPFYYCYGLSLLHTHLRVGGSVVLNNSFVFIGSVINDLKQYQCTGFAGVPSHFQILLRKSKDFKRMTFPSLRYVTQAGGKLHPVFIREFTEAFPDIDFIVMYGQTEATARLSYLPPHTLKDKIGSIGRAIPGVELRVVDDSGKDVMPGETGEIIARGKNIMAGYYGDTDSTGKTIRDGWLHTGDLATVDDEGYIFIQSRKKEILKVRGIRISPKEIEEVIFSFPGVVDCSIEMETGEGMEEYLKAVVFVNETELHSFSEEAIRSHCAKHLAQHKVPQKVLFETRLRFNAAGKKTKQQVSS